MTRTTSTRSTRDGSRAAESVDRVLSRGGRNVMANAARHLCFSLVVWTAKWLSRTANAIRLRGLPAHRRRVLRSLRILRQLRAIRGEAASARAFCYLRRIDPLVCEEVVLSALEDVGSLRAAQPPVFRRRWRRRPLLAARCGLEAACRSDQEIKRYDAAVTPSHIAAFGKLVGQGRWAGGLFVHCGRTGPMSHAALGARAWH